MTRESAQKHAALIRAFAAGHRIESDLGGTGIWDVTANPEFNEGFSYSIALPDGKSYHNPENITEEQLGKDHRFCLLEEYDGRFKECGEYFAGDKWYPVKDANRQSNTFRVPIETLFHSSSPPPKTRPFTVDDITPNMVFRVRTCKSGFATIRTVEESGISFTDQDDIISWLALERNYLYSTDGKTFHPCSVNL